MRTALSSRTLLRASTALVVAVLLLTTAGLTVAYEPPELGAGTITEAANTTTAISVQGFHFQGEGSQKKPARLLMANETGNVTELHNGSQEGASWFYDVDPLENGNLLVTSTIPGDTVIYEFDPDTDDRVWEQQFDAEDTHDAQLLNEHELLVANMRNTREDGVSDDRLFIYNLTSEEVVWEWYFRNHYPEETDGGYDDDWTHVNDVDRIEEGRFLVSPRNFDQTIVVNRSTREIEWRLGEDDNYSIMHEQHNPDYLETPDGEPTVLVADSENDRVVEYTRTNGTWERVWEVGNEQFNWPRDADRLPSGNTLITDSLNHRVIEVTPTGEIVWEVNAPWGPYDAERMGTEDESNGPTMQELGVAGQYNLSYATGENDTNGSTTTETATATATNGTAGDSRSFPEWLKATFGGTPIGGPVEGFAETWEGTSQWIKPVWMAPWGFVTLVGAVLLSLCWGLAELVINRRRIYERVSSVRPT